MKRYFAKTINGKPHLCCRLHQYTREMKSMYAARKLAKSLNLSVEKYHEKNLSKNLVNT